MNCDNKFSIWCPLVGFDMYQKDRGVSEYLAKIGAKPEFIALFVFNPDLVYLHENMDKEFTFPENYCNYYGSVRNEIREIQPWTNFALRELVANLKAEGIKVYFSFMGLHTIPKDVGFGGNFGYICQEKFLIEHEEVCIEGKPWTGHTWLPKRMSDGNYFADFFGAKLAKTLTDYGADGVHLGDGLFPPCMQLLEGDVSYDMLERFEIYRGKPLPKGLNGKEIVPEFDTPKKRAEWIWENLREEWITFNGEAWAQAIKSIADALHAKDLDLFTCNAWTSEPFEAIYRYGIDYAKVAKAGIDIMTLEQQASSAYLCAPDMQQFPDWEKYSTSMLTKAYAKETKYISMNFVKDSTEEASVISHAPVILEKEIHQYMNWYLLGDEMKRASEGYYVCLGDALKKSEWETLIKNYEKVFGDEPVDYLGPIIGWSDCQINKFLPEYIKTRRWSAHKFLANINRRGAGITALGEIGDLKKLNKDVFIPNADLLSSEELEQVNGLKGVGLVLTTIREREDKLSSLTGFTKYYDEGVNEDGYQSVIYVKAPEGVNLEQIYSEIDFGERLPFEDMSKVKDTRIWTDNIVFRTVSDGFLKLISKIVRKMTFVRYGIELLDDSNFTLLQMKEGRKRIIVSNPTMYHYSSSKVLLNSKLKSLESKLDYPIQPVKLVMEGAVAVAQDRENKLIKQAKGFLVKTPPAGIGIVDFCIEDK